MRDARHHSWDLLVVIALALSALAIGALARGPNPALTTVTLPLALLLPGYALVAALLPFGHLGFPERLALSLGVSIALAVLCGLLLHALRIPLGSASWRVLLSLVTLAAAGYALLRRGRSALPPVPALAARMHFREALLLSAGALLIGLALGLGSIGVARPPSEPFTQFWALSGQAGDRVVVRVGLTNEEGLPVTYRIVIQAGDWLVAEWPSVSVRPRETWEAEATVPQELTGQVLTTLAYRANDPSGQPYRRARITVEQSVAP